MCLLKVYELAQKPGFWRITPVFVLLLKMKYDIIILRTVRFTFLTGLDNSTLALLKSPWCRILRNCTDNISKKQTPTVLFVCKNFLLIWYKKYRKILYNFRRTKVCY